MRYLSIRSISATLGFNLLQWSSWLVNADPMTYLEKPWGLILKSRNILRMGEGTNPSRFSSMITISFIKRMFSVETLWNLRFVSMVRRSVLPLFTKVMRSNRFSS